MKSYIYIVFFVLTHNAFGQSPVNISPSVVTGCGGALQGWSMISLNSEFTLGEIAIETVFGDEFMLTQGFHQGQFNIIALDEHSTTRVKVYPNPTIDIINIEFLELVDKGTEVFLLDHSGRKILKKLINSNKKSLQVHTNKLSVGTYFVEVVTSKNKDVFKIQKLK